MLHKRLKSLFPATAMEPREHRISATLKQSPATAKVVETGCVDPPQPWPSIRAITARPLLPAQRRTRPDSAEGRAHGKRHLLKHRALWFDPPARETRIGSEHAETAPRLP